MKEKKITHTTWFCDFEVNDDNLKNVDPNIKDQVYAWGAMDGQKKGFSYGTNINQFIAWIQGFGSGSCTYCKKTHRRQKCLYKEHSLYFFNGSRYDYYFLMKALARHPDFHKQDEYMSKDAELLKADPGLFFVKQKSRLEDGQYRIFLFKRDILKLEICWNGYHFSFYCLARLFPNTKLAHLGAEIGYDKGDIDFKVGRWYETKEDLEKDTEVFTYLKRDCEIAREVYYEFTKIVYYKHINMTIGSTAYYDWMRRSKDDIAKIGGIEYEEVKNKTGRINMKLKGDKKLSRPAVFIRKEIYDKVFPTRWLTEHDTILRQYYRGGIVWVNPEYTGVPIENIQVYDITSSYPASMTSDDLLPWGEPVGPDYQGPTVSLYAVECLSEIKTKGVPIYPIRAKDQHNYQLYDYCGQMTGYYYPLVYREGTKMTITDVEWEWMQTHYKGKFKATKTYIFKGVPAKQIYGTYMNFWINRKATTTGIAKRQAKLFANSLYGKAGQKNEFENAGYLDEQFIKSGKPREHGNKWTPWLKASYNGTPSKYLPLAIWITALSRMRLVKGAGLDRSRFAYCDTDSIALLPNTDTSHIEVHPTKLGAWKKEKKSGGTAVYLQPKLYIVYDPDGSTTLASKGMWIAPEDRPPIDKIVFGLKSSEMTFSMNSKNGKTLFPGYREVAPLWDLNLSPDTWFVEKKQYLRGLKRKCDKIKLLAQK